MDANLAGFADAQQRLRMQFGETAVFLQPPVFTYPPGTQVDPDSGEPFDPLVTPTASAQVAASANVNIVFVAQGRTSEDAEREGQAGFIDRTRVMLIADIADRAICEGAVTVVLGDRGRFQVTAEKCDGVGEIQRWLTYARRGA